MPARGAGRGAQGQAAQTRPDPQAPLTARHVGVRLVHAPDGRAASTKRAGQSAVRPRCRNDTAGVAATRRADERGDVRVIGRLIAWLGFVEHRLGRRHRRRQLRLEHVRVRWRRVWRRRCAQL